MQSQADEVVDVVEVNNFLRNIKMKKNAGRVAVIVLLFIVCLILVHALTPAFAIPRSFDNGVRFATKTAAMTETTANLFDVDGGPIEIVAMFGQVTTTLASTTTLSLEYDADAGSDYDGDFTTEVDVNGVGAGDILRFSDAIDEGLLDQTSNVGAGQALSWFCPEGMIEQKLAEAGTGVIVWYMSYRRLDRNARVISQ